MAANPEDAIRHATHDWGELAKKILLSPFVVAGPIPEAKEVGRLLHGKDWLIRHATEALIHSCTLEDTTDLKDAKKAKKKLLEPLNATRLLAHLALKSPLAARRIADDRRLLYVIVDFAGALKRIYVSYGASQEEKGLPHRACLEAYALLFQTLANRNPANKAVSLARAHLRRLGVTLGKKTSETALMTALDALDQIHKAIASLTTEIDGIITQMNECFEILFPTNQTLPITVKEEPPSLNSSLADALEYGEFADDTDDFADAEFDESSHSDHSRPSLKNSAASIKADPLRSSQSSVEIELGNSSGRLGRPSAAAVVGIIPGFDRQEMEPVINQITELLVSLNKREEEVKKVADKLPATEGENVTVDELLRSADDMVLKIYDMGLKCRQIGIVPSTRPPARPEPEDKKDIPFLPVKPEVKEQENEKKRKPGPEDSKKTPPSKRQKKDEDPNAPKNHKSDLMKQLKVKR